MATPKKRPEDLLKVGRHSDYKPEYCEIVRKLLRKGCSKIEIAYELDVNRKTLDRWAQEYPEFCHTITEDLEFSEGWWTKKGRKNLNNKDFNSRLYELNMMNRFGWMKKAQEKHDLNISHEESLKDLA